MKANPTPPKIFVSHSRADDRYARRLASELENRGLHVFTSERRHLKVVGGIASGVSVERSLRRGLKAADWHLVLLSDESIRSPWLNFELGAALAEGNRVFPIFLTKEAAKHRLLGLKTSAGIVAHHLDAGELADRIAESVGAERTHGPAELTVNMRDGLERVAKIAGILKREGVHIESLAATKMGAKREIRVVVADARAAKRALREAGIHVARERGVLKVNLTRGPVSFARVANRLAKANVDVDAAYLVAPTTARATIAIGVKDLRAAKKALRRG